MGYKDLGNNWNRKWLDDIKAMLKEIYDGKFLPSDSIGKNEIKDNSITENKIKDNEVTNSKLRGSSVTEDKIKDRSVTRTKIAENAVTSYEIADGEVKRTNVDDKAIDNTKIADLTITDKQIANESITLLKLDGSVTGLNNHRLELKYDGYRLISVTEKNDVTVVGRSTINYDGDTINSVVEKINGKEVKTNFFRLSDGRLNYTENEVL